MNNPVNQSKRPVSQPNGQPSWLPIQSKMGFNPKKQFDPVSRAEKDMTALNPDIDNKGGSLYNFETFNIVHRYETPIEQQCRENYEDGNGYVPDIQEFIIERGEFYESYDDSYDDYWDEPTFVQYGDSDDDYYYNDGASCDFSSLGLGASIDGENLVKGWNAAQDSEAANTIDENFMGPPTPSQETDFMGPQPEAIAKSQDIAKDDGGIVGPVPLTEAFTSAAQPEPESPDSNKPATGLEESTPAPATATPVAANSPVYQQPALTA